jgi:hypothetical protein
LEMGNVISMPHAGPSQSFTGANELWFAATGARADGCNHQRLRGRRAANLRTIRLTSRRSASMASNSPRRLDTTLAPLRADAAFPAAVFGPVEQRHGCQR